MISETQKVMNEAMSNIPRYAIAQNSPTSFQTALRAGERRKRKR